MSQGFDSVPSIDGDESRYYNNRSSLDVADSSYDEYRRKRDTTDTASLIGRHESQEKARKLEDEENSAPLRKSVRLYRKLVGWMLLFSIVILYSGFDSAVVSMVQSVKRFQLDYGAVEPYPTDPVILTESFTKTWPKDEPYYVIPSLWLSMWDGVGPLGQLTGTFLGGFFLDRIGRKMTLVSGSIIGCIAIAVLSASNKPAGIDMRCLMMLIGKVVQGVGIGMIKMETFTYMSEVIPVSLKGPVMSLVPTFTLLGQLIGAVVVKVTETMDSEWSYVIPLASQYAVALPPLIFAFFIPESPAYLLKKGKTAEALKSFTRLLGRKHDPNAALQKMKATLDEEAKAANNASYAECFNAANRRRSFISFFAGSIEFAFGLSLLSSISYFLQKCGMAPTNSTSFMIVGILAGLVSNSCSSWTVSHIGRRKLMITTLSITAGLWALMGFTGIKKFDAAPWVAGGCATAIVVTCGLGCSPASYALLGETSSIRLRAKSQAIGGLANNVLGIAANFFLPIMYNDDKISLKLGAKTGFLFTGLSGTAALITYLAVPELKGRSAIEIDHFFAKKVPSRGSSKWKYTYEEIPMHDA